MKKDVKITFQNKPLDSDSLKEITHLIQLSFDSDAIKVKALYDGRLIGNAKYINNHLVCSNCESDVKHFKFIMHALDTNDKEREIYQCQNCGQYIFALYNYEDYSKNTF